MTSYPSTRAMAIAFLLSLSACATAPTTQPTAIRPEIHVEQLPASAFDVKQQGAVSVAYRMTVKNPSTETITLRELKLKAVGRSAYTLQNTDLTFSEAIAPGEEKSIAFNAWANPQSEGSKEKTVWLHGTAVFDAPSGTFTTTIEQSFPVPNPES